MHLQKDWHIRQTIRKKYNREWQKNLNIDPNFSDPPGARLNLSPNSKLVDAGDWLTSITSHSGTGTSFEIGDSTFFTDGWGIIEGDTIQLEGKSESVRIKHIDYATNTIEVESLISWSQGDGVAIPYS